MYILNILSSTSADRIDMPPHSKVDLAIDETILHGAMYAVSFAIPADDILAGTTDIIRRPLQLKCRAV